MYAKVEESIRLRSRGAAKGFQSEKNSKAEKNSKKRNDTGGNKNTEDL